MRLGLWVLTAVFFGALITHFLLGDKGYVLLNFRGWVIETSIPVFFMLLAGAYLLLRMLVRVVRIPRQLGQVVGEAQARSSGDKLTRGLIAMAEGDWQKGERLLGKAARSTNAPLINYLMAARAAQLQGDDARRDEWLKLAYDDQPKAEAAILLTQAELQMGQGDYEVALANLNKLSERHPDHPVGLGLLARAYKEVGDWDQLAKTLPRLARSNLTAAEQTAITQACLAAWVGREQLETAPTEALLAGLPKAVQGSPAVIRLKAEILVRLQREAEAEKLLLKAIKQNFNDELVLAFGRLTGPDHAKRLKKAEGWLKERPENAAALLAAARLSMAGELWGKARSYLETSIGVEPTAEAYQLYGRLLNELGEDGAAAEAFQSGLSLATTGSAQSLPALTGPKADSPGDDSTEAA